MSRKPVPPPVGAVKPDPPPEPPFPVPVRNRDKRTIGELEQDGWQFCIACDIWADDTVCYPDDHSRHCGHALKPVDDWDPQSTIVQTCVKGIRP